ncbi:hypothetical protein KRR26_36120, partial [Corallococcus sp. M34]|nr:hypothetical protein [Citreicoccus inhibens]
MAWFRWFACGVGVSLVLGGCARNVRPVAPVEPESPLSSEHVLALTWQDAAARARALLDARGLRFEPEREGGLPRTDWRAEPMGGSTPATFTRYVIAGSRVDAERSVLRIFRVTSPSRTELPPGRVQWTRDEALEQEVASGLSPGAVVDADVSNLQPRGALPLVRDANFYAESWKAEATGGLARR